MRGMAHARTAFISIMAIARPMHACGPTRNASIENAGWYSGGGASQRSGHIAELVGNASIRDFRRQLRGWGLLGRGRCGEE